MIRQAKTITLIVFLTWLFGCSDNKGTAQAQTINQNVQLEDITSRIDTTEGFYDIYLKIISEIKTDSTHIYVAKGLYKHKIVGLQFEVNSKIAAGIVGGNINSKGSVVASGVRLKSIGQESDEFVKAMAELYGEPLPKAFSRQVIPATAFSLNQKAADLDNRDVYKFKLFFGENDENLYSEIFFNINTEKGEIELPEKDEGYREPLIKVWTK